jgi:membrane protein DedA with SNARE-associated domain
MWWQYILVFIGSFVVDVVPLPLPPAFTVMILLQIVYDLNIWIVILVGVLGSILGRYILTLYIPRISGKLFKPAKNEEVQFLGSKMKKGGWKSQGLILLYSLLPLPTTPLFIAGGMAKMKPIYIIPPFVIGKFISDMAAVLLGEYAAKNVSDLTEGMLSWKTITGLVVGVLLVFALLFVNWTKLMSEGRWELKFKIWK